MALSDPTISDAGSFPIFESHTVNTQGDIATFLSQFEQRPSVVYFKGRDPARPPRMITTLLHGNEPSGAYALQRLIECKVKPIVDCYILLASLTAATTPPLFHYRMLPEHKDLNRCFLTLSGTDPQTELANRIVAYIESIQPEVILDMHNTSGDNPAFSVTHKKDEQHATLGQLFSPYIIYSSIQVGAMFERDFGCPIVTIECGGANNTLSHEIAFSGLHHFFQTELDELNQECDAPIWLEDPIRLELVADTKLAYADSPCPNADLTLPRDIDSYNFGLLEPHQRLGWVGKRGKDIFKATNADGDDCFAALFTLRDNQLYPAQALHVFMITTRADIALSDCLLYAVVAHDE
ncbi:M14 family metallopeptidase [Flocculibacter collagenilyticus]|uniref:succinylglutamate desuccinylase/aspartoacylase domain-containing protein n=1 Tax=Flocculibacter collagenilyticus TaxID=2744479 RepID=UPI0018F76E8D|nr:succinylglutamate desuccinylase/aspartoacylase family protein [Flocculibacter collagenilyticus]